MLNSSNTDILRLRYDLDTDQFTTIVYGLRSVDGNGKVERCHPKRSHHRFFSKFPERQRIGGYSGPAQNVPATDISVGIIREYWDSSKIKVDVDSNGLPDSMTLLKYNSLVQLIERQKINAQRFLEYKGNKTVPTHCYAMKDGAELMPYQQVALCCSMKTDHYALFMEQGTGKTAITIANICNKAKQKDGMMRVLIVCPNAVRLNWDRELEKFSTERYRSVIMRGGKLSRAKTLVEGFKSSDQLEFSVVIAGYEAIAGTWDFLQCMEWDLVVLDESHYIKSPTTKRTKHMLKLRDRADQRMVLTGTPVANVPADLYTQLEFLNKGGSGFRSWKAFRNYFGEYDYQSGFAKFLGILNKPFLQDKLSRMSFSISKKEALPELPDKVYDIYEVEMHSKQQKMYDDLCTSLMCEIDSEVSNAGMNEAIVVNNILTQLLRLSQITSGFLKIPEVVDEDGNVLKESYIIDITPNPKLEALIEILKVKEPNQKTLIWAHYIHDIENIVRVIREEFGEDSVVDYYGGTSETQREIAVHRFNNDPKCRFLVGNPGAGGVGLNLLGYPPDTKNPENYDTNCDHEIYFSQDWSALKRSQSESRPHRRGTRQNIRITDLTVPNTIDEEIRARVTQKLTMAMEISDIRDLVRKVCGK